MISFLFIYLFIYLQAKPAPNEFITSMMDTEHPLDEKMDASEMTLVKVGQDNFLF